MGEKPCAQISYFTFLCTEIEAQYGSLEFFTDLAKLGNFLLETHMNELGGIKIMERYNNVIFDNNLSCILRKHVESVKAPN